MNLGSNTAEEGAALYQRHREQSNNFCWTVWNTQPGLGHLLCFHPSPDAIGEFNLTPQKRSGGVRQLQRRNHQLPSSSPEQIITTGDCFEFFRNDNIQRE